MFLIEMFLQFNVYIILYMDYKAGKFDYRNWYFSFSNTCNFVVNFNKIKYIIMVSNKLLMLYV